MPGLFDDNPNLLSQRRAPGGNRAFHNYYNDYTHVADPNLRRRLALSEIDRVPLGLYHLRAVLVAGVGFFLDSYDIFAINLVIPLLGIVFWSGDTDGEISGDGRHSGHVPDPINQALKASTSAGIVIGMILFGWLADLLGRRRMYGIELAIIIVATFSCALVSSSPAISAGGLLIFWRVIMGVGVGADYPLSSVITTEFAPTRWRGAMVAAVFSTQGLGQLAAAVVALVTTVAFKGTFIEIANDGACDATCRAAADRSWRIIVGVGAIPACLALYYRITIPETPRYTFDVQHDVEKADADIKAYLSSETSSYARPSRRAPLGSIAGPALSVPLASWTDVFDYFGRWKNLRVLIGTTMSWFFLDLAFYGLGLNNGIVLNAIGYADGATLYHKLYNRAMGMIILACAGSIPGYWFAIFTIDTIGRKPLQIIGFLLLTIVFGVLGFMLNRLSEASLLGLYIAGQFLFNAGPNTTTFVVSGECFPTRYRATGHGISAAMGKIGAIIAQGISIPILRRDAPAICTGNACSPWLDRLLQLFALFMLLGLFFSLLIPETKGVTLEELSGEPRTSYNAGYHDRDNLESPGKRRNKWSLFSGGQPAGFHYPRTRPFGSFAPRVRRGQTPTSRVGIMTSPVLASENARRRRPGLFSSWRTKERGVRVTSYGHDAGALSPDQPRGAGGVRVVDEPFPNGMGGNHEMPSWGAGWGRVDRALSPSTTTANLQDVGSLLSKP